MPASAGMQQGKEVIGMAKNGNCGCGCVPPGKTEEPKVKAIKTKPSRKQK